MTMTARFVGGRLTPLLTYRLGALLGCDLSGVRLRTSAMLALRGVRAATQGQTVYLASDLSHRPLELLHVLAHELAHVAQQAKGDVDLDRRGPPRARVRRSLEREADALADAACALWPGLCAEVRKLDAPGEEPAGECLYYPRVRGRSDLPTDVDGWVARFHRYGRQEVELPRVLNYMSEKQLEFDTEKEFVYLVRMVVENLRRPKVDGNPVTVGIPYRDDGRGAGTKADVELVHQGTMCQVIVLVPPMFKGVAGMVRVKNLEEAGIMAVVAAADCSLKTLNVDALYVSGGPHDHPDTVGQGRPRSPGTRQDEAQERHDYENALIQCAMRENIPILGICGGSWRVAGNMGGEIRRLGSHGEHTHAGRMDQPQVEKHTVTIQPATMLNAIVVTDNYRNAWPTADTGGGRELTLPVNSVHWAQSVFPLHGDVRVSAEESGGHVTEAFESRSRHFQIGIQWHPEYAQNNLEGRPAIVGELHRRILAALGDAATDGRAARVLQRAFRAHRARTSNQ